MKLLGGVPVIACQHIEQTLAFYQRALQFVILNRRDDPSGLAWVHLQSGDVVLMLEKAAENSSVVSPGSLRLYFYVDEIAELHHYLIANQMHPGDLFRTDYGSQEFDIVDPEGNRLTLGQKIPAE